ncbi:DNA-directed RNA polymerase III subunit RPC4-like isoform X2 [Liolophura sinensis]|uniref:DNA-directed RNA polymerase III subunit RPC4-like isoform X2 n=1 Tax=Liolophura sinensis TaxID=3198878 RepID=UPI0031580145
MASGDAPNLPRGLIGRRGTPTGKSARLPSLRGPRDLTLGGVPKKSFTPSIPVRKDRSKAQTEEASSSGTPGSSSRRGRNGRPERGRGGRGRGRGRGRDENILQSHSIFEQGPTERRIRHTSSFSEDYGDRRSRGAGTSRSTIKKEKSEDTKRVLDNLLRDDFIDDSVGGEDSGLTPIYLPLSHVSIKEEIRKDKLKPKLEIKAGQSGVDLTVEPDVDMPDATADPSIGLPSALIPGENMSDSIVTVVKKERKPNLTCKQIFTEVAKSEKGELLFFQLPDVLPGEPPSSVDDTKAPSGGKKQERSGVRTGAAQSQSTSQKEEESDKTKNSCKLKNFSEGHIGKIQIRKSGKTQLILGNIVLDVLPGTTCSFLQEAVSVKLGQEGGGHMTVLGQVDHKVTCVPDFEKLLKSS